MTDTRCAARESSGRCGQDTGSVLVAVDGNRGGWDAVEWAAAEAAARGSALRIGYAVGTAPSTVEALVGMPATQEYVGVEQAASLALDEAAGHARAVAPGLRVSTRLQAGTTGPAVARGAHGDDLVVVGRGHRPGWVARLARTAGSPVAVIGLSDETARGPSAGRVVLGFDGFADAAAVDFAFRAARRRGVGLTAVQTSPGRPGGLEEYAAAFPDVDLRRRVVAGPLGPALVNEAVGAALLVVGARPGRRIRQAVTGSAWRFVLRHTRGPVTVVGTPTLFEK